MGEEEKVVGAEGTEEGKEEGAETTPLEVETNEEVGTGDGLA